MKIDINYTRVPHTFSLLVDGDTFESCNAYWMKTERIDDADGTYFNAVNLENGDMVSFDENDSVIPIRLKVVFDKEGIHHE